MDDTNGETLPDIRSKRDLSSLAEVFDFETGDLLRSTFFYISKDDTVWFGEANKISKFDLNVEHVKKCLKRVDDKKIYPTLTSSITILPKKNSNTFFIKRPKFFCLDNAEETRLLPQMLLEEAEVLEIIMERPHPNIIYYYGCTAKNGRITGIALEKYERILQYRFKDESLPDLDITRVIKGVKAGISHLHSLGFAHNDLNPMNIALDHADNPIILDFGSCRKFDAKLISGGTPGWIDEDYDTSLQRHDEIAIQKLEKWLDEKTAERSNG